MKLNQSDHGYSTRNIPGNPWAPKNKFWNPQVVKTTIQKNVMRLCYKSHANMTYSCRLNLDMLGTSFRCMLRPWAVSKVL